MSDGLKQYLTQLEQAQQTGQTTEHTYRAALDQLIQSQEPGLTTINEPRRIACGAPDLTVLKDSFTFGYIKAKDVSKVLDEVERADQLKHYRRSLDNLILTDYLEFRLSAGGGGLAPHH